MNQTYTIDAANRNGNLHINVQGAFTAEAASCLTHAIARSYLGKGNIFIHTARIIDIAPESRQILVKQLEALCLPLENLYLTGKQGLAISPDRCKVIVYEKKKKGCCERCTDCPCHDDARNKQRLQA